MAATEDELEETKGEGGMLSHYKCYEHKNIKEEWDKALEKGTKRICPDCKVGGIKDDACTRMTCFNCDTVWCYFCGKEEANLDQAGSSGEIWRHNEDWNTNNKRCPSYLTQVGSVDARWSTETDEKAQEFLHKILTYEALKEFFSKYSDEEFNKLCEVFPTVANHGYDLEEAKTMDLTLIHR